MTLEHARMYVSDPYNLAKIVIALALSYFFAFVVLPAGLFILRVSDTVGSLDITTAMRASTVITLADQIDRHYLDADKAPKIAAQLRRAHSDGAFDDITSPTQLARRLTDFLYIASNDAHFRVDFRPDGLPEWELENFWPPAEEFASGLAGLIDWLGRAQASFGVDEVSQSARGIGYLKLHGFYRPEVSADKFAAALDKLADSKALIIDLRNNGGGHPETVALLASYFFDKPTHLSDMVALRSGERRAMWTRTNMQGKRYGERRPVYILTNHRTISAGEDFAYSMQKLGRATIVGGVTRGAANATAGARLGTYFIAAIPVISPMNSVTKTNWEGSGVRPDIAVHPNDALTVATNDILKKLANRPDTDSIGLPDMASK